MTPGKECCLHADPGELSSFRGRELLSPKRGRQQRGRHGKGKGATYVFLVYVLGNDLGNVPRRIF